MSNYTEKRVSMLSKRTRKNHLGGGFNPFNVKKNSKISPSPVAPSPVPPSPVPPSPAPAIVPSVNKNNASFLPSFTNFGRDQNNLKDRMYIKLKDDIANQTTKKDDSVKAWDSVNRKIATNPGGNYIADLDNATKKKNNEIAALEKLSRQMDDKYPKAERDLRDARQSTQAVEAIIFDFLNSNAYANYTHTKAEVSTIDATTTPADVATKNKALVDATTNLDDALKIENEKVAPIVLTPDTLQSQYNKVKNELDDLTARISGASAPSSGSGWGLLSGTASSVPLAYATPVPGALGAAVPFSPTDSFIQVPAAVVAADVDSISVRLRRSTTAGYTENFYPENIEFFKSGVLEKNVKKFGALEGSLFDVEPVVGKAAPAMPTVPTVPTVVVGGPVGAPGAGAGAGGPMGTTTTFSPTASNHISLKLAALTIFNISDEITILMTDSNSSSINTYCQKLLASLVSESTKNNTANKSLDNEDTRNNVDGNIKRLVDAVNMILSIKHEFNTIYEDYMSGSGNSASFSEDKKMRVLTRLLQFLYVIMYYLSFKFPSYIPGIQTSGKYAFDHLFESSISGLGVPDPYKIDSIIVDMNNIYTNSSHGVGLSYPFISSMKRIDFIPSMLSELGTLDTTQTTNTWTGYVAKTAANIARDRFTDSKLVAKNSNMMFCIAYYLSNAFSTIVADTTVTPPISALSPDYKKFINTLIRDGKFYKDIDNLNRQTVANITFLDAAATPATVSGGRKTRSRAAARRARRTHTHAQRLL